ncbi:host attachment protein [Acetobacter farinalis]|uniref:Host attachment protein n=1 Tax=Acetobacter farinalis TaxID=1260984 RepID=A0ABT3Q8I4_9PROT|nr:host attachment protein [Acetobacter farinalis]MCX2561607.1 host attachment protein [Acetobacter farinalis]NHO30106.1 peptidase [Acetobacter farinalis]
MSEARDGRVIYVVADGGKVRFLHDSAGKLHDVQDFDSEKHEGTPGKLPTGATPKDAAKDGFARVVADRLNALANSGEKIDGFVLAAPPSVLHEIRTHLGKPATAKLIKTFDKDFTNIPAHDLRKHFDIPVTGWVLPS